MRRAFQVFEFSFLKYAKLRLLTLSPKVIVPIPKEIARERTILRITQKVQAALRYPGMIKLSKKWLNPTIAVTIGPKARKAC